MNVRHADLELANIAAAIAEPARARMLCCLLDGHARTSTELAVVAEISPSTASVHLARLKAEHLVTVSAQGRHRYYTLAGADIGVALEALLVVAGLPRPRFAPTTPSALRHARKCYDHMAGTIAVKLHDHWRGQGWLVTGTRDESDYVLTEQGAAVMTQIGIDVPALSKLRRRMACPCIDWSERRPHVAGALGAAFLQLAIKNAWVEQDLDSRILRITARGNRQFERMLATPDRAIR